ncbi:unnamed protein product [Rotaria sordida]|uniref:valine--tRNA ligase n=1 Tax=Rotaria sordida TaxID=392033 RepID=A0A813XAF6_9BILA|nr:unnamed protein product [Rotaria sordida]CAF1370694.1 unnamed protein product [Rotaria sordida]
MDDFVEAIGNANNDVEQLDKFEQHQQSTRTEDPTAENEYKFKLINYAAEEAANKRDKKQKKKLDINCELPSKYSSQYIEAAWYNWWEKQGFFRPEYYDEHPPVNASTSRKKFLMVIPPPNVTGYLHLGHAIMCTFGDILSRWHRMCGDTVLWVPGCDHAGIATEVVVEKTLINEQKLSRHDLGREKFLEEVWKWKNNKVDYIYEQMKILGTSCDWSRQVFTMDKNISYAVEEAFIRMHEKKLIYRSTQLVNWSCTLKSAISDIEVKKIEIKGRTLIHVPGYEQPIEFGVLIYFSYPVEDSNEKIIVGTTRLETMLGDTAIIVHPDDQRYKHLHSKYVQHPFVSRRLPILTDTMVDPTFGFGAVKVTPAHDQNDFEYGRRLSLQFITCINDDGLMSSECGLYSGKPRFEVRQQLLNDLKQRGLYYDSKENKMILPICSYSKDIIEPLIKPQWYVNCKTMAQRSIDAIRSGELKILPTIFESVLYKWLEDIHDWCISRQLWWGHHIPAYFISSNDISAGNETNNDYWVSAHSYDEAIDKASKRFNISKDKIQLTQDENVLDTWFSSSLVPFSSFGWPTETDDFKKFFPTTLLETGHDIHLFSAAHMVMISLELTDRLPFTQIYLHPMVEDASERKVSQSLGNVIHSSNLIHDISLEKLQKQFKISKEDYPYNILGCGIDILRFACCANAVQDQFINLDEFGLNDARTFCYQLWKIIRSTMSKNLDINDLNCFQPPTEFTLTGMEKPCDLWILSRLSYTIEQCEIGFNKYRFRQITTTIYNFWIYDFLDFYMEYIKKDLYSSEPNLQRQNTIKPILYTCLNNGLRLMAPIMPYLSEELYQRLPKPNNEQNAPPSLCVTPYPQSTEFNQYRNINIENNIKIIDAAIQDIVSYYEEKEISSEEPDTYMNLSHITIDY